MVSTRLLAVSALTALAVSFVNAATLVEKAKPVSNPGALNPNDTVTDASTIANTAAVVDQKSGASSDSQPPDHAASPTAVTAVDGDVTNNQTNSRRAVTPVRRVPGRFSRSAPVKRFIDGFENVFNGTGTGPDDRDGSVEGTAYLTFTTVDNSTYNVDACVTWCAGIENCVFVNLYYEYNNPGLDAGSSNLKCAAYADTHSAAEKTNRGGQQLYPAPGNLTYIQQSSGWSYKSIEEPAVPEGYDLVFGPNGTGASNANGYMGFSFLDRYDVQACADLCNTRGADANGGSCQYFNIWRAVVNGNPTTYTCSMYFIPTDASTAVNYGQGDLEVTFSRGYKRQSLIVDGGFESYFCPSQDSEDTCWTESDTNWVGQDSQGGHWDTLIFSHQEYAHSGHSVATFGSGDGSDNLPGTLKPVKPLQTEAGKTYTLEFFVYTGFNDATDEANASLEVKWNGKVLDTVHNDGSSWTLKQYQVTAQGNDLLEFDGGSYPAYVFIDDVNLFLNSPASTTVPQ